MDYKDKYLKYKKKYVGLKSRVGGGTFEEEIAEATRLSLETEPAGEKKEDISPSFDSYPRILSKLGDTDFKAGSARGDGYCSIWSVIIGRSLISEILFNPMLLEQFGKLQPTTIQEVIEILLHVSNIILILMDSGDEYKLTDTMPIFKLELNEFIFQLETPFQYLNIIEGVGQIKILAYLMNCNIIIKNSLTNNTYSFNESGSTIIRISTNIGHYYTHNVNTTKDVALITTYWWDHMWTWFTYPPLVGTNDKMIPFIN